MNIPIQVVFKNMKRSSRVEEAIKEKAGKLERIFDKITSMRVTVELPHKHHKQGNNIEVSVSITVPDKQIVVSGSANSQGTASPSSEAAFPAVKDAFEAAKRKLEDYARKRRRETKSHEPPPSARISQIFEDYGFLETFDGREIYFHSNSVVNDKFEKLAVGTEVVFVERQGDEGPQASTVKVK